MAVPYADLHLQYQSIKSEIDAAVAAVIRDSAFIRGPYVDAFEREFAVAVDASHCISCANGTDALYIAMVALKVKPGDEVITTAHSWISTSAMITHAGATVVFCDTDRPSPSTPRQLKLPSRRARSASFPCISMASRRTWTPSWRSRASTDCG